MKKYAVSHINFFDNVLSTKIVEVDGSWKDALKAAEVIGEDEYSELDDLIEIAKTQAFDSDWMFDVVTISSWDPKNV